MSSFNNAINFFNLFLRSKKGLGTVLLFIFLSNILVYSLSDSDTFSPPSQARKDASGFSISKANKFAYFHYYKNQFPLATLNTDLQYSEEGATEEIASRGKDLIMEYQHWSRLGEHARIFAFLPDAYVSGSPKDPSVQLFNSLVFIIGLLLLYWGFWKVQKPGYGLLIVVFINLTPFFLYEVFSNQNIFGVLGSVFFMILGINLPQLFSKPVNFKKSLLLAIISALIIGFFSEFRNEISVVMASLVLIFVLSKQQNLSKKLVLVLAVFLFFNASKKLIQGYFDLKFDESTKLVIKNGGHVYNGAKLKGHNFWHPVFCGLGDYDTKYGYEWNDKKAYQYAIPILNKNFNMNINYSGKYHTDDYYDKDSLYYKKPEELVNYETVVKEKVISDIKNDPLWYITILVKRIFKTLTTTIPIPYVGWLLFPLVYYLWKRRKWDMIKLIIVSFPLSATSIIIYSGKGSTYNSVFVYFVMVIGLMELYHYYSRNLITANNE